MKVEPLVLSRSGRFLGLLVVGFCLLPSGCGHSNPETVSVKGKVTYGGGPWPAAGVIYFTPTAVADGFPRRPARAAFDTHGDFHATSFRECDGLVPGRYTAAVECWKVPPSMSGSASPESYVPVKYQSSATSGLELNVRPEQRHVVIQWDVPKP